MRQLTSQIRSLGAEPVAVAVTATFSQQAFAAHLELDFPLLSDWNGAVAAAYGVQYDVWKEHVGVARRSVFVIDPDGRIRFTWVTDDALVEPDLEAVLGLLQDLAD